MTEQEQGLAAAWYRGDLWLWVLRPLEVLFRTIAFLRRQSFRHGLLNIWLPPVPTIVIGNITVGGTGKTPIVIALVEALQASGIRVGVVSRGYGASDTQFPHVVTATSTAAQCGDEPLLIVRRTGAPCVVDPNRVGAAQTLLEHFDVDVLLSDDGLQHYALGRHMEIAVVDANRGLGNGFCLPAGPLREPASRLRTVDFVLQRGGTKVESAVTYQQGALVNLHSQEERELASLAGERVYGVAGIGQPEQFFTSLKAAGLEVESHIFVDHHRYSAEDFMGLTDRPLLMTEKDAVKCAGLVGSNAWYLRISAKLPQKVIDSATQLCRSDAFKAQ